MSNTLFWKDTLMLVSCDFQYFSHSITSYYKLGIDAGIALGMVNTFFQLLVSIPTRNRAVVLEQQAGALLPVL